MATYSIYRLFLILSVCVTVLLFGVILRYQDEAPMIHLQLYAAAQLIEQPTINATTYTVPCLSAETSTLQQDANNSLSDVADVFEEISRIPHRIHQTYKDENIPNFYHAPIQSWLKNHPNWEFYFWSDADAARLIRERYPQFWSTYQSYKHALQRSDAIRYFVLHQYGGVYADMDVRSLKPIESFLQSNTCVLVPEPPVQSKLLYSHPSVITNAIMASIAHHPFLAYLLDKLPAANRKVVKTMDVMTSTGPFLLNTTYSEYTTKFPDCAVPGRFCSVYAADFNYLVPTFDRPNIRMKFNAICKRKKTLAKCTAVQREACADLKASGLSNAVPTYAYTDHSWLHHGWRSVKSKKNNRTSHINDLVAKALRYSEWSV